MARRHRNSKAAAKMGMTIDTSRKARAAPSASPAACTKFKTFAVAFAVAGPILYFACLFWNLPLVTYHPAMNRIDFGWTPAVSGEGPAMYWYGWTLTVLAA